MKLATTRAPIVDYLVLEPQPHLVAHACRSCGARFFDHRIGCAACSGTEFEPVSISSEGVLRAFTIMGVAPRGITTPYVAGIVDCDGSSVRANILNVDPTPAAVSVGMRLRLCVFSLGTDAAGVEAIGFAFEPQRDGS
jgi:uncharacterized OB-fold protein